MADYRKGLHLVPEHMRDAIAMWIEDPRPPKLMGGFLCALLSNDLMATLGAADDDLVRGAPARESGRCRV